MTRNNEVYAKVTAAIVDAMKTGVMPWTKPWVGGVPRNALSLRPYHGVNVWATTLTALLRNYTSSGWATFRQALELGLVVRKGEKGTPILFMSKVPLSKKVLASMSPEERDAAKGKGFFIAQSFTVFNLDQLTELEGNEGALAKAKARVDQKFSHDPVAECEDAVVKTGAVIAHRSGEQAHYDFRADRIGMPLRESFKTVQGYYGTLFHELGHWTGHESRLNRQFGKRFGDNAYGVEELVAELTAAFLCQRYGFDVISQSAAYLDHWLKAIASDPSALVAAASAASAAAERISPSDEGTDAGEGEGPATAVAA